MMINRSRQIMFSTAALVLLGFALQGCGSNVPSGQVTGTVKVKGENAKAGTTVMFSSAAGTSATGLVGDNGTYTLKMNGASSPEQIPTGSYTVAVFAASNAAAMSEADYERMMSGGGKAPEAKKDTSIPAKYNNANTSGLKFDVQQGSNTYDININ